MMAAGLSVFCRARAPTQAAIYAVSSLARAQEEQRSSSRSGGKTRRNDESVGHSPEMTPRALPIVEGATCADAITATLGRAMGGMHGVRRWRQRAISAV
ncbi:hypothetical protein HPB50_021144 [Hyalomma asiaticum]|uniref:Uncharacterized protein n=1 Tax=Hyalomma asiaticum TaxID=266040 RepID=A0ACB7TLC1_HYAAI|nr:hypothetical protein HPB50_021144 [Hyalomma asiaticum]